MSGHIVEGKAYQNQTFKLSITLFKHTSSANSICTLFKVALSVVTLYIYTRRLAVLGELLDVQFGALAMQGEELAVQREASAATLTTLLGGAFGCGCITLCKVEQLAVTIYQCASRRR